jgi:hypothetical protein
LAIGLGFLFFLIGNPASGGLISVDPGPVGAGPLSPITLNAPELVGIPVAGQTLTVDVLFSNNKFITYHDTHGLAAFFQAALWVWYDSALAPKALQNNKVPKLTLT